MVERERIPGGRNGQLVRDGFTFDTGPTVLTMRDLVADALRAVDADLDDAAADATARPGLPGAVRRRLDDPGPLRPRGHAERDRGHLRLGGRRRVRRLRGLAAGPVRRRDAALHRPQLRLPARPARPARTSRRSWSGSAASAGSATPSGDGSRDERLHRLFSFQAMYAGLAPDEALAIYAVITYMDSIEGVWFPEGGMHAMPVALATAAEKAGAEFRYGASVAEVLRRRDTGGVAGVRLDSGEQLAADAVVCTLDLPTAYEQLLPDLSLPRALRRPRYSPSAVVWHVGVRGLPDPEVGPPQHPLRPRVGERLRRPAEAGHADGATRRGWSPSRRWTTRPWPRRAARPCSSSSPSPTSPTAGSTGSRERGPMRERLLRFLDAEGYPTDVVTEELVTPLDWQRQGMAAGHPVRAGAHVRPDRPLPAAERGARGCPGWSSPAPVLFPGSGCPWCSSPGSWRPIASRQYLRGGRGQDDARVDQEARVMVLTQATDPRVLRAGYRECGRLTRQFGTTYFWGAALLPRRQRKHVYAVYALCRLADDIVDLPDPTGASDQTVVPGTGRARPLGDPPAGGGSRTGRRRQRGGPAAARLRGPRSAPPWSTATATTRCWPRWPPPPARATSTRSASTASSGRWRWT